MWGNENLEVESFSELPICYLGKHTEFIAYTFVSLDLKSMLCISVAD